MSILAPPARLYPLRYHREQQNAIDFPSRFKVVPAGRRSGKTEIEKRKLIRAALSATKYPDSKFFAAAPTRDQAKRIFWNDLKAMTHPALWLDPPREGELILSYVTGAQIHVLGMDVPERVEGTPWDGGVLDEYGNMKPQTWPEHVRPALSDRMGWCDLIGVPEGRNHYYDLAVKAQAMMKESGRDSEWSYHHWNSSDILPASEIEAARRDLDPLTFQQEYEGSFVNFVGRAYYQFDRETHCARLEYNPKAPLAVCFDFNVDPGVAVICQEQVLPGQEDDFGDEVVGTGVIGEVHIPQNSNTPAVCRKILEDWGDHDGPVSLYGDATGGARGSAKVTGSDWDIIKSMLHGASYRVPPANPTERSRLNSMNTRLRSASGVIRLMVDPVKAPNTVKDLDGVRLLEGGSGEIDKKIDPKLSHLSDALGYYVVKEFPVASMVATGKPMYGRGW